MPSSDREFRPGHIMIGGRMPPWRGPNLKLPDEIAQAILDARPEIGESFNFKPHGELMRSIAAQYEVSVSVVQRIWRRQSYGHLRRADAP
jgi:hypothetical protein